MLGHESPRHAQDQIVQHPMMALFERRQPHVAQHVFAQATSSNIGMQQKLMLDVVAHALAQPITAVREIDGAAPVGNQSAIREPRDFLLQLGLTHRVHDSPRVHALLREHFDLVNVHLPAGSVDGDRDLHLIAAHQELSECGLRRRHLAAAGCCGWCVALVCRDRGVLLASGARARVARALILRIAAGAGLPVARLAGGIAARLGVERSCRRRARSTIAEGEELVEARVERSLLVERLRQHEREAVLEQAPVAVAHQLDGAQRIERFGRRDANVGIPQRAYELRKKLVHTLQVGLQPDSLVALLVSSRTSGCTFSMSSWNFRMTFIVLLTSSASSRSACSSSSVRAQSIVSLIDGTFFRSRSRRPWMKRTSCVRSCGGISGTRALMIRCSSSMSGNGMYRCRQRRFSASEISRVLLLVRKTSGGSRRARTVPISGIETWKSDRSSSRSDSNS